VKNNLELFEHNRFEQKYQQLILPMDMEITIPANDPVRLLNAQLEELDYRELYRAYSPRGRKSAAEPRVIFEVMVYGYLCGIYSTRKLEEACRKRVDFMWLLQGEPVPDYSTFARFRSGRTKEAVEDLFYQYVRNLDEMGETNHNEVFIDGTKIESAANRYTFV
jgi:transposase